MAQIITPANETTAQTILRDVWVTSSRTLSASEAAFFADFQQEGERALQTCLRVSGLSPDQVATLAGKSFSGWREAFKALHFSLPGLPWQNIEISPPTPQPRRTC
jgi:hypothetical protein